MGFYVKKLASGPRPFKIQFIEYSGDAQKIRDLGESEWALHGFSLEMPVEDVRARAKEINARLRGEGQVEKHKAIQLRLAKEKRVLDGHLKAKDVEEFERNVLADHMGSTAKTQHKIESHWRRAKRILVKLDIDPTDWFDLRKKFYEEFTRNQLSLSYTKKIIAILNLWGSWHCRKYRRYFEPIPFPRGHERERIADKYYDKAGMGKESAPLTPEALRSAEGKLPQPAFNWLWISLYFGLRPKEVDSLAHHKNWRTEMHQGTPVLFVYQTKLTAIAKEKRWKYIPAMMPEQRKALDLIRGGSFKRPIVKTVRRYCGEGVNLYGGRKGFEALMTSRGYRLEDISLWLGHQSIERTWRNYKDRQRVSLPVGSQT